MIPKPTFPRQQAPLWQHELRRAFNRPADLLEFLELDPGQPSLQLEKLRDFPLRVPYGFAARMKKGDARDPLFLQVWPQPQEAEKRKPAVPVSRSVHHDYIVCLEDGKQLKMLKRYLRARYDMSPDDYRRKWNLPADYPMVAPAYAERRSQFARDIGLGKGVRRKKAR